jgi:hypothetical protein
MKVSCVNTELHFNCKKNMIFMFLQVKLILSLHKIVSQICCVNYVESNIISGLFMTFKFELHV